jgi:hypothetical protein
LLAYQHRRGAAGASPLVPPRAVLRVWYLVSGVWGWCFRLSGGSGGSPILYVVLRRCACELSMYCLTNAKHHTLVNFVVASHQYAVGIMPSKCHAGLSPTSCCNHSHHGTGPIPLRARPQLDRVTLELSNTLAMGGSRQSWVQGAVFIGDGVSR